MKLTRREIALLHQCIEHSLTHIEEIEDITDEFIEEELKAVKHRLEEENMPTKKEFENFLNATLDKQDTPQLAIKPGTYLQKPGSWMRKHDPIQFEVGYNEYCNERRRMHQ